RRPDACRRHVVRERRCRHRPERQRAAGILGRRPLTIARNGTMSMKPYKRWMGVSFAILASGTVSAASAQMIGGPAAALALQRKAPVNAPNIVLVLLDDVGFGAAATFGGPARTPAL